MSTMADKKTSSVASRTASKTLRNGGSSDGRSGKDSKSAAGSALVQHPMSKQGKISSRQAERAVNDYLSGKRA